METRLWFSNENGYKSDDEAADEEESLQIIDKVVDKWGANGSQVGKWTCSTA